MLTAVVLAAGLGTRMHSPLAKVLHPLLGRPMVGWVIEALRALEAEIVLVVGHQAEVVEAAFPKIRTVRQQKPMGTGDALRSALPLLPSSGPVLVLAGDTPLVQAQSLSRLLRLHQGAATVASFEVQDPHGYGRIVREKGALRIVEQVNCTEEEALIREVNSGAYVFEASWLQEVLPSLAPHPPKNEYYLTDCVGENSHAVGGFAAEEFMGINDRAALAEARRILRRRINRTWALAGVDFADLEQAEVEPGVWLGADAKIGLGTILRGNCRIEGEIGPCCELLDTVVEKGGVVKAGTVAEGAFVGPGASVGPMAHLRPGARLEAGSKVGNFVEVKNAVLERGAKASHLTYLGDARIGEEANIGAGTITCNYDGFRKHFTEIGAGAFIGSNSALVAPIKVGAGAIVGAGTTVTEEVPADAIAVGRSPLKLSLGAAPRLRLRLSSRGKR